MKKLSAVKGIMAVALTAVLGAGLMACGGTTESGKTVTIGIGQFAEHGSLDNCRKGFIKGLKASGYEEGKNLKIVYENAGTDGGTAAQITDNFISSKVDMICAITTPMAQTVYSKVKSTDIPIIFTAVTNPVMAGFANEDGTSVGNITGTSDRLPIRDQLKMIKRVMRKVKTVGILYCTSETNSESAVKEYKEIASEYDIEIIEQAVTGTADVPLATDSILAKVDCLCNITDNTVVNSLDIVLDKAKKAGKLVFGSEVEQVKKGCIASMGLDYVALGEATGKMAAEVLKGNKKASEMNFETFSEAKFYGNTDVAEEMGIEFPEEYAVNGTLMKTENQ